MRPKLQAALGTAGAALCVVLAGCGGQVPTAPLVNEADLGEAEMGMNDALAANAAEGDAWAQSNEADGQGPETPADETGNTAGSNVTTTVAVPAREQRVQHTQTPIDTQSFRPPPTYRPTPMPPIYRPPPPPPPPARPPGVRPR